MGALTSKPYAFHSRPWELESAAAFDFYDPLGTPIKMDLRGQEPLRITPRPGESAQDLPWIGDKIRFSYDGFRRQRLTVPLVRPLSPDGSAPAKLRPIGWRQALEIFSSLSPLLPLPGGFSGWETFSSLRSFYLQFSRSWYFQLQRLSPPSFDWRSSFLLGPSWDKTDLLLMVGCSPRLQAPLLNLRFRRLAQRGVPVLLLGSAPILNFPVVGGGSSFSSLLSLLEGRHRFSSLLALAVHPLILWGRELREGIPLLQGALSRPNLAASIFCLLAPFALLHGAELNFPRPNLLPPQGGTPALWLLEEELADSPPEGGVVYQGHHGDRGASVAQLLLPSPAPLEEEFHFLAISGEFRRSPAPLSPPLESRSPTSLLAALGCLRGSPPSPPPSPLPLAASSFRGELSPPMPFLLPSGILQPPLFNGFLSDVLGRSSPTMALASRRFTPPSSFRF